MVDIVLSRFIVDAGRAATVAIHVLILLLLGWTLVIRWLRVSTDRRRARMVDAWRPLLAYSLIEPPAAVPPIHPRDRLLFLYLWNHLQESIKGESSDGLCAIIRRTGMDRVVHHYLAKGTLRQQLLAIVTLGHLKDRSVWDRLVALAHDTNSFRSIEAARALVRIDAPRAVPALLPLISHRVDWSPLKVMAILQGAGEELVAHTLGQAALAAPPVIAARLIRFLASIRSHRALPMIRHLLTFLIAAGIGALVALALRSAWHQPYSSPAPSEIHEHPSAPPAKPPTDPHAGHAASPAATPVNSICAICGMKPDPTLTTTYQGKTIAFGCKGCPEKFKKDPDRYGPYFLRSEEAP